ncbi:Response regulator MprA [Maioricimonas rarisocia]|uniref:Response regulator MprA n=1 Tax=Maioricimonas rarisocia TaxID=2528026 RepID=A0A517ZCZ5_9PLAN|nr:response regulator [Maioricimonas rarisocia]QDU40364.1 Response regulator MprA [Maioricimonas rarisocia]
MTPVSEQHLRLVIADDDRGFRETLLEMLPPHIESTSVENGEAVIEVVQQTRVDLVLLDMHMPRLTGLEAIRIVKSYNVRLPCILMTADLTAELHQNARLAAVAAVLAKPFTRKVLIEAISTALQIRL